MARSRRQWVLEEKGELANHFTVSELAAHVGVSAETIDRWVKLDKIPPHSVRSPSGWRLWSPEVARQVLEDRKRGRL